MRKDSRVSRPALKRISGGGLVLALVALFGLPTAAFAAPTTVTLTGDPGTVLITGDGSDNAVTVSSSATHVNVVDTKEGVTPGAGCAANPLVPGGVRCAIPAGGVTVVNVNLNAGDDTLQASGTDEPMVVNGGLGIDVLNGGQQSDTLNGGDGNDTLDGKGLNDTLNGDADIDTASYIGAVDRTVSLDGAANDGAVGENDNVATENIITGGGDDTLTGDGLNNRLEAGAGTDTLNGAGGDDTLVTGSGPDAMNGGTGIDNVSYNPESRAVSVTAGDGTANDGVIDTDPNTVGNQGEGDNVNSDVESISGGGGSDFLVGGTGAGTIAGSGGNDVLNGGADTVSDTINGGNGLDTVSYEGRTNPVNVTLDGIANDGEAGENDNVLANVERATGGSDNDSITGNASINILNGGGGNDALSGGDQNDTLIGGAGNDTFNGGSGTGDLADYSAELVAVTVTIDGVANDGPGAETDNVGASVENVRGGSGNDTITGSAAANTLTGGDGDDTLNGGGGNDTLNGQNGDDTLNGGAGSDTLNGALGADTINGGTGGGDTTTYAGRASAVFVNVDPAHVAGDGQIDTDPVTAGNQGENDNVLGSVERVTGTNFDDTIIGEVGAAATNPNIWNGGNGEDTLRGGDGNDTVNGGGGKDLVVGNRGRDSLVGGSEADHLVAAGDGSKDSLNCGTGVDTHTADAIDFVSASCE